MFSIEDMENYSPEELVTLINHLLVTAKSYGKCRVCKYRVVKDMEVEGCIEDNCILWNKFTYEHLRK